MFCISLSRGLYAESEVELVLVGFAFYFLFKKKEKIKVGGEKGNVEVCLTFPHGGNGICDDLVVFILRGGI